MMHDESRGLYVDKGQKIYLTFRENIILSILIKNKKKVTRYDELTTALYGVLCRNNKRNLEVTMNRLRNKLNGILEIYNKRGVGYCLYEY